MIRSLLCTFAFTALVASVGCSADTTEPEQSPPQQQKSDDEQQNPTVEVDTSKLVEPQAFCTGPRPFCGTEIAVCTCGTFQHPCRWRCP